MATRQEINEFLAAVERRAFKQAVYAVRNEESALDLVQEAMFRLADRYADRPLAELAPLFQRILKNAIYDHFRREKVRNLWTTLLSSLTPGGTDHDASGDPLEFIESDPDPSTPLSTAEQVEQRQLLTIIEQEIKKLPKRQREAFLLRYWEEFSVAEAAAAMGCSEGSVKTHCSRATHALAKTLRLRGIER